MLQEWAMSRIKWCMRVFPVIFSFGLLCLLGQQAYGADLPAHETRQVQVKVGDKSKTFSWAELQAFPLHRLNGYEPLGTKKGPLGRHDWEGVSLAQLILAVDPLAGQAGQRDDQRIVVRSQDGWQALFAWNEVFGEPKGGKPSTASRAATNATAWMEKVRIPGGG